MPDSSLTPNDFLSQLNANIEKNIGNEQFGVSELAALMNMSRSNLLRKVKKETDLSVSQLISQVRLKRGMDLLKTSSLNVSEVSHAVGFSSTSYFIKCFREYYGYPPGEAAKRTEADVNVTTDGNVNAVVPPSQSIPSTKKRNALVWIASICVISTLALAAFFIWRNSSETKTEKAIAVLPFKNDSNDSTNVYLINGLMESTLNNLQKIKDLKVISRTSTEVYRNRTKSIPEMGKELNVNYFVEGSGQKIGNEILLNIQLIEASTDKHLWAQQYKREAKDIFALQQEIAKSIATAIEAVITPEEKNRIEKNPTDNLVAYDFFLKGRELSNHGGTEAMEKSTIFFKKAIEQDPEFSLAYAELAMVYYYLDIFQAQKKYAAEINLYADKALLLDSKSPSSLVAKAMFYMHKNEYEAAVPFLEKALVYNPNSALVINFLSDLYNNYIPNTAKYLEYALMGARLDVAANDSTTTSYNYLHLGNALIQNGFVDESLKYINKSLDYNPENPFSGWVKVFILYAKNKDIKQTRKLLEGALSKDTTSTILAEEVGKVCYMMRDYEGAYQYYKKFIRLKEAQQLDVFKHESLKIAIVLNKTGRKEKAEEFALRFKEYADQDKSIYHNLNIAAYHAYRGDEQKTLKYMKLFLKEDNFQYWVLLMNEDPLIDYLHDNTECKKVLQAIETKFWNTHNKLKGELEEKGLL